MAIRTRFSISARSDCSSRCEPRRRGGTCTSRRLTETVSLDTTLTLEQARPLPEGAVDIVYCVA